MAAKNLDQAIEMAFARAAKAPMLEFKDRFKEELRDFFAHEVMKYVGSIGPLNTTSVIIEARRSGARELFDRIFEEEE